MQAAASYVGHILQDCGRFHKRDASLEQVPYTTRKDATYVSFKFKKDVPLRTVLNFTDACQGFGTFNGVSLKGRLILPNIYKVGF